MMSSVAHVNPRASLLDDFYRGSLPGALELQRRRLTIALFGASA